MTESKKHSFLKDVGMAFLYNQNCFLVATEVHITSLRRKITSHLDNHLIIDVCGVGEKYVPLHKREFEWKEDVFKFKYSGREIPRRWKEYKGKSKFNIVRGLEVKVSRSDFKNGFVCSGCNYNYLMIPEGLVYSNEVPKNVGVVKVDMKNFKSSFDPIDRFSFQGLRVTHTPKFQQVEQWQIDNAISHIARRSTRELVIKVAEKLAQH